MLRIRLVGELALELDGRALDPIASRRARSLLAWLAYHPGLHPRTRIASVFWPDVLESSARGSLRTALTTLRRSIGDEAAGLVVAGRDRLGIEDGPGVWIDVRAVGRLAAGGRHDEALALCDHELLTDLDDDWVLEERRAHRDRVVELLAALGDAAERAGDLGSAVRHARRRADLDPVSEDAARVLMRRLAGIGDGAAAVAAYETFRAALRRDLGMAPSAETRALVDELRSTATPAPPLADVRTVALPGPLAAAEHMPLVGRRGQLAALGAAWERARAGAALVAIIDGEAGGGKTRLLVELATQARADGATVLAGRCLEDGVAAFAPFTEALRPHVAAAPGALPDWVLTELARLLPELDPERGMPAGEPQAARHRLFEAVAAAVGQIARRGPLLLVIEDLHWADVATLRMLTHVIWTVGWAPLLVAGSLRAEGAAIEPALHDLLGDLRRAGRLERVALGGLSEPEAAELAAAWLPGPAPPALTAAVLARTGGNPLFVEELVRHLVESHPGRPAQELVAAAGTDVPLGVRSVIDRRLARLAEPAGRAVRVAAVAGEEFALADVAAACECSDEALAEALEAVVGAGLVDELSLPGRYRFAHALIREAVLAGMAPTRRALAHRRMADVLEALPDERRERRCNDLARHLLEARPLVDADRAARVALAAAEQATRRLAYEDAAELLRRALAGDLDERDPCRAEVLLALGEALLRSADAAAADRCFDDAAAVARAVGDAELLARAALGTAGLGVIVGPVREPVRAVLEEALSGVAPDSELRPRLLARLAIELYYEPPTTLREDLSAKALSAGRSTGGRALLEAMGARHVALWSPDHTEARLAIADELIAAARAVGDREAELQGINWRVADLFELGDRERLLASIDDHERLASDLRLPSFDWYVPLWRATLALFEDRHDEAQRLHEQGERIGRAAHDANAALLFEVQRLGIRMAGRQTTAHDDAAVRRRIEHSPARVAWAIGLATRGLARGDRDRALVALADGVAGLDALPMDANWLYPVTGLGVLAAHLQDESAAVRIYPRLLPYGDRVVTVGRACACAGSASLSLGLLAITLGERAAAVTHLEEAERCNEALGGGAFVAFARHALAGVVDDPVRGAALRQAADRAAAAAGLTLPDGLLWRL